jgi:pyrimidine operon attenuation protein / uracil phosphoribosyltransferase
MRTLLSPEDAERGLRRLAGEIVERHRGVEHLLLVGIRRGGVPMAEWLASELKQLTGVEVPVGSVDISLYRDDAAEALPNPRIGPTRIPYDLKGYRVVLCDDVLFTGRTIRAAIDALFDYGRPAKVELAVIIERGGRELPIQADYVVKRVEAQPNQRVDVIALQDGFRAVTVAQGSPTTPPPAGTDQEP